ncbi:MAG: FAD-binding oxidoreductase, partial [Dehalococcoidia bacterium]|nr:FAD-binding oxidoreductase [Dehalococcoidia bacterium]
MSPAGTVAGRVVEGRTPSAFATVERARELLHEGEEGLAPLAQDLAAGLSGGAGDVEVERYRRLLYATDASIYEMEPVAVVYPRSAEDVRHVMRVAGEHGVPVLPRGGGTSLSGQTVNHAIVLDFTPHMAGVLAIDVEGQTARVQPGVVLAELNKALRPHGLQYPIDPSTANRATIGGGVGNNSCGAHSGVYGKTVDNVIALEVVLADGSIATLEGLNEDEAAEQGGREGLEGDIYRGVRAIAREHRAEVEKRFPKILRRVSGYNLDEVGEEGPLNLAKLVVGSEGTLATVTEATVRVVPIPPAKMLGALHFRTVVDAAAATVRANAHGPSAVELVDDTIIERCRESAGFRDLVAFVQGDPGALLLVEFAGERAEEVEAKVEALRADLVGEEGAFAAVVARE